MNALHAALTVGFTQSQPTLGEPLNVAGKTVTAFVTQSDDKIQMELIGYMDTCDLIAVISTIQFPPNAEPKELSKVIRFGVTYEIRAIKRDESAFVLGLKKIST